CSALVPCLSPPGTLTLDDFADFSPVVREELRLAVHAKRLCGGGARTAPAPARTGRPTTAARGPRESTPTKTLRGGRGGGRGTRSRRPSESEKLESVNADLKAQIEELKQQKQRLVYMLNLHRPTCIVRAQHGQTPEDERNLFLQHIKESTLQLHNLTSSCSASTNTVSSMANSLSSAIAAPPPVGGLSLSEVHCAGLEAMDTLQSSCLQL
ncbi:hypothetical protein CRUP_013220, partial [Coryphaenoides rupestris]